MATPGFTSIYLVPFLFATCYAHFLYGPNDFELLNDKKLLGPHELFGNPFGNAEDYKDKNLRTYGFGNDQYVGDDKATTKAAAKQQQSGGAQANTFKGSWQVVTKNSGVSAMHVILLPKVDKVLMFDSTIWRISNIKLANGECRMLNKTTGEKDCWAHSVLFDIKNYQLTPLKLDTDTWCSSGGLTVEGNLISTGGFQAGANSARYLDTCRDCTWREYPSALAAPRWYSTQVELADGSFIVIGGREAFSYEFIPPEGKRNKQPIFFDFLKQTDDPEENNLYPFSYLAPDGNVFIFANQKSLLLNPRKNMIIKTFPDLPGGHRSYPASGLSVLIPIKLRAGKQDNIPAEVLVCGGSAHIDSYSKAEKQIFYNALNDCGRMRFTDPNPVWKKEIMPSPRIMGDIMLLPTGDVLILSGAKRGSSGWGFARDPNFTPVLYKPTAKRGTRFTELNPSNIPRMYHCSAVTLPNSQVLVAGSNTNNGYIYDAMFPTELRVEYFSPPYLNPSLQNNRPVLLTDSLKFSYGNEIKVQFKVNDANAVIDYLKVTMNSPPFTTHGISMNQRLLILGLINLKNNGGGKYTVNAKTPPNCNIAPPGYYMLSAVYKDLPSEAIWVRIK